MAVYKRDYKPYQEGHTPGWSRFLVLPRYLFQDVFDSRIITIFFIVSFMPFLGAMLLVYLRYNVKALEIFELPIQQLLAIDSTFFLYLLNAQCGFGLILTVLVGPGLVSMDLANNALPMYFCRPFSRTEYVLGKMCVLAILLSAVTWIPLTVLFGFQASLEGFTWLAENLRILFGVFLGAWVWILLMCFLSLAISAWVRWRPVAGAMLFGVFLVLAGFGEAVNQIVNTRKGTLLNLRAVVDSINAWLFQVDSWSQVPVDQAWLSLGVTLALCLLILNRKLKAYEIVR